MDEHEQMLIDQIQQGNKDAFNQMYLHYFSPLCEYANHYVSEVDAEEVVQEVMLHIWENRGYLVVEKSLKSFLFVSVKNRCLNMIRDRQSRERVHQFLYEKLKDQFEEPDYYMLNELATNIEKSIDALPENYRDTFKMSRFDEMTNAAIAEQLGVSIKTIEYRITQALKILRVKFKDYLTLVAFLF